MTPEPVSPELVLIDPELARRERARLEEKAYLKSVLDDVAALRRAAETQLPPVAETVRQQSQWRDATTFAKRRLVPAALLCSLAANGFLVAHFVAGGEQATQVAARMVTLTESAPTLATVPPVATVPTTRPGTKVAVERKVVSLILSAARKLPSNFIDPTTGLVKNNVQVVCRKRQQQPRSFLCAVRLPSDSASKALYVRYNTDKNGNGAFKWFEYRRS